LPTGLQLALAGVLIAFAAVGLSALRRPGLGPAPFWIGGWMAAGAAGVLILAAPGLGGLQTLTHPLGSLFPFLLLAGALELANRPIPQWLLPAALSMGLSRYALAATGHSTAAYGLALAVEPAIVLAAGWVTHRALFVPGAGLAQRLLGVSFVPLAIAGSLHVTWLMLGLDPDSVLVAIWMVVAPPTLGLQIYVVSERNRSELRNAREDLERRVSARTQELAEANQALRASEERYRTVSELSSDFSFAFRLDPRLRLTVEWITGAFQRLAGVDPQALADFGWQEMLPPEARDATIAALKAARPGEHGVQDIPIHTDQHGERLLELRAHTLATDTPNELRVLGSARDVTEARRALAERRDLEHRMHESARLESLGRLSGGIAHDFNNLLSVILGNARLAEEDLPEPDPLRVRLMRIRTAGEHAARLTDQMLTYAGKAPTDRRVIDVSESVAEMSELVRASLPEGCQFEIALEPGLCIEADETQIRQVVLNLITNAGEALADGKGRVDLRTGSFQAQDSDLVNTLGHPDPTPGEYAVIEVADTGCGMDSETRERIFDPFFSTKFTGRGMGLASVLGIVRSHGGVASLESAPGQGTRVRVLLPRVHQPPTALSAAPPAHSTNPHPGSRIMVVDDDPDVLEVAGEFLRREGFQVVAISGGREAIERLREDSDRIAAVILDLSMPDMGGEEAFLEMRAIRPELPVILASGFSQEFASIRFSAPGSAGFLRKPYSPEDMLACLNAALR
jgi:PAS domain S-box-containing protein